MRLTNSVRPSRVALRSTAQDEAVAATLQRALRDLPGNAFITRSDTMRCALRIATAAFAEGVGVSLLNHPSTMG